MLAEDQDEETLQLKNGQRVDAGWACGWHLQMEMRSRTDPAELVMLKAWADGKLAPEKLDEGFRGFAVNDRDGSFQQVVEHSLKETSEGLVVVSPFAATEENRSVLKKQKLIEEKNWRKILRGLDGRDDVERSR